MIGFIYGFVPDLFSHMIIRSMQTCFVKSSGETGYCCYCTLDRLVLELMVPYIKNNNLKGIIIKRYIIKGVLSYFQYVLYVSN